MFEHTVTIPLIDDCNINGDLAVMSWHGSIPLSSGASFRQVEQVERSRQTAVAAAEDEHFEGSGLRRSIKLRTHSGEI